MIEVEKKFLLSESDEARLLEGAEFLSEKSFTDIYYDRADYALSVQDKWLRARDGKFELKVAISSSTERLVDQYDELEDEAKIREALHLDVVGSFIEDIARAGYSPFCTCKTTRRKYSKDGFIIDLDSVDFGDFTYKIGEIELMVDEKSQIDGAIEKIFAFAKEHGLAIAPVRGKVREYLERKRPEHYQALITAGIIAPLP
ncbi:MAG: CYTH domain-containing protein [Patescibacteria group bacterium]